MIYNFLEQPKKKVVLISIVRRVFGLEQAPFPLARLVARRCVCMPPLFPENMLLLIATHATRRGAPFASRDIQRLELQT